MWLCMHFCPASSLCSIERGAGLGWVAGLEVAGLDDAGLVVAGLEVAGLG